MAQSKEKLKKKQIERAKKAIEQSPWKGLDVLDNITRVMQGKEPITQRPFDDPELIIELRKIIFNDEND